MRTSILEGKRILMVHQRDWGIKHGFEISKKLYSHGAKLATINFKKSTEYFINNQKEIKFNYILDDTFVEENVENIILKNNYTLNDIKKDYDVHSIWQYASTLRRHSLCYKKKFPFSYEQGTKDEQIENYVKAFAFSLKELYENFRPELVIGYNFGDIRHLLLEKLSNKNKVPFFFNSDTKIQNISCFYYDIKSSKSFFRDRIKKLNLNKTISKNYENSKKYIEENLNNFKIAYHMREINLKKKWYNMRDFRKFIFLILYHFKKNKNKNKNIDQSDSTSLIYLLRDYIAERVNIIKAQKFNYDNIENIDNFVFFPLQHFPESQLGLLNTVHDHVLNTIRNIAKFLPNGLTLVVKDHPWSYGKRSESFLNKIKNTLNVKLIAPTTSNNLVYEKMDYLISLSGTVIFEAALINKPAIILGDLEMMLDLPNIFKLQNLNEIGELIKKIDSEFKDYSSTEDCKKKILNYISAALDIGYDNEKYNDDFRHNKESLEYMWKFYLKEINKIYKYKNKFIFN